MLYCYVCGECGARTDEFRTMERRDEPAPCGACAGGTVTRDPWAAPPHVFIPGQGAGDLLAHRRWFHSPETQARLRSGELELARRPRTPYGWEDV